MNTSTKIETNKAYLLIDVISTLCLPTLTIATTIAAAATTG
jgi:hypothetical protein